jgi:hypothetical protein
MALPDSESAQKTVQTHTYSPSVSQGTMSSKWQDTVAELKYSFFTKDGWIGDYVSSS